jgi:hypothetical protein
MSVEFINDQAIVIHRQRDRFQPSGARRLPHAARTGILDPDLGHAVAGQRMREMGQSPFTSNMRCHSR